MMKIIKGTYSDAKVFTHNIDEMTIAQNARMASEVK